MAGAEETLVLTDASVQDRIRDALTAAGFSNDNMVIEPATNWPGQELAVDLYAGDPTALASMIAKAQTVLRRDAGITDAPTSAEYARRDISAAS